jgi:hypothetical protein
VEFASQYLETTEALLSVGQEKDHFLPRDTCLVLGVIVTFLLDPRNGFVVIIAAERFEDVFDCAAHGGQSDYLRCGTRAIVA